MADKVKLTPPMTDRKTPEWADVAARALDAMPPEGPQLRSHRIAFISQALLSAYERGKADKERDLAVARQALIDWLHIYAPDLCNSWKVDEARVRVGEHGTIAYIAKALAAFDPPAKENDNER